MPDVTTLRSPSRPGRWLQALLWRLPILLFTGIVLAFYLRLPYRGLDADVTTFGLMGNDLFRYGYPPTLTYGQNYLFSATPYLYALLRWLIPSLSAVMALAVAGSILSLGGVWLMYEGLLTVENRTGRRRIWPFLVFCALIGSSWTYIFDLSRFSSIELATFLLGATVFLTARMEQSVLANRGLPPGLCGGLGLVGGYALYSRPQMAIYVALAAGLLWRQATRHGGRCGRAASWAMASGLAVGYLPMLLHLLLRASHWPFQHHVALKLGSPSRIAGACRVMITDIMPGLFDLGRDHGLYSGLILFWIGLSAFVFVVAAKRKASTVSTVDWVWALGSALTVAMMIVAPRLSADAESRRYCLQLLPGIVWLFARFGAGPGWRRLVGSLLTAGIVLLAMPQWSARLESARRTDQAMRHVQTVWVPYLKSLSAPVLTEYWDAYLLAFLADGTLKVEAYPWNLVRTYGLLREEDMRRRTVWFVTGGHGGDTYRRLTAELGSDAMQGLRRQELPMEFLGREGELWEFADGETAVVLMRKFHPSYFVTPYPPGSRRERQETRKAVDDRMR